MNRTFGEARADQLPAVGLGQIDPPGREPRWPLGEDGSELHSDFRSDLIAANADAGSDHGKQFARLASKLITHPAHRGARDIRQGSAPAGVNCRHGAPRGCGEQDGQTVRRADSEQQARAIGDKRIPFPRVSGVAGDSADG